MPPLRRAPVALLVPLSLLLLTACGRSFVGPELSVTPQSLVLDGSSPVQELWIDNVGSPGSVLDWNASGSSSLLNITPASGSITSGAAAQRVVVSIDVDALQPGSVAQATLVLASNGGDLSLPLRVFAEQSRGCFTGSSALLPEALSPLDASRAAQELPEFVPGELLVGYAQGPYAPLSALATTANDVREDHGLRPLGGAGVAPIELVAADDPVLAAESLAEDPRVAWAHPNYYLEPQAVPDDPCLADQWHIEDFGVAAAWQQAGSRQVVIAVIDTGTDIDHEDLRAKALPGWDFSGGDDDPRPGPGNRHGTHVAGIALAQGGNGVGVAGVAQADNFRLLPVKVFSDDGRTGTTSQLVDAILWSAGYRVQGVPDNRYPAQVINVSLGAGSGRIPALDWAVEMAVEAGTVVVAAAGNNTSVDGSRGVQSPASSPFAIAVGSVDQTLRRSSFSDWGSSGATVDLMAPGGQGNSSCGLIRSTLPAHDYGCMAGTSMAAPFVAGVAALVLSSEPGLTPAQTERRLKESTSFDPAIMDDRQYGRGVLCADLAVAGAGSSTPPKRCGT